MYTTIYLTELGIRRRIWVYLPGDYAISQKRYPVLYMQDGQNLFDLKSSFSGEWEIDEYLDSIDYAGIVVGIDNGGDMRMNEYNPNDTEEHGMGLGWQYLNIIVSALKPYIDQHFRTSPGPGHTAMAGSSMGGLISFYAGLYHPKVFGAIGAISPAFWLVPELTSQIETMEVDGHKSQRYFFYGGGREDEKLVEQIQAVSSKVRQQFGCHVSVVINEKGTHSERSWRKMFPDFYAWLMKKPPPDNS